MEELTKIKIAKEIKYNFEKFPRIAILSFIFFLPFIYYLNGGFENFNDLRLIWWLKGDYETRNSIHNQDDLIKTLKILNIRMNYPDISFDSQPFEVVLSDNTREVVYDWNQISIIEDALYQKSVNKLLSAVIYSVIAIPMVLLIYVFFRYSTMGVKKSVQWVNENAEKTID